MSKKVSDNSVLLGYNPLRDISEVEDGLSVDITDMLETGVIKDSSGTLDNNGIDDPHSIIGLVRDTFAAIDAARAIRKLGRKTKPKEVARVVEEAAAVESSAPISVESSKS